MKNETPCQLCPFYDEDSDGCAHPNFPPCDYEIVGFEVRACDNPKPFAYVDYGEDGGLYYAIECTQERLNYVINCLSDYEILRLS